MLGLTMTDRTSGRRPSRLSIVRQSDERPAQQPREQTDVTSRRPPRRHQRPQKPKPTPKPSGDQKHQSVAPAAITSVAPAATTSVPPAATTSVASGATASVASAAATSVPPAAEHPAKPEPDPFRGLRFKTKSMKSPFKDNKTLFDNPEAFPNLTFVIPNSPHPVRVHRAILSEASMYAQCMMRCKCQASVEDQDSIGWLFPVCSDCEPTVLLNVLQFFYGFDLVVSSEGEQLCATVAVLRRFQITCAHKIAEIESFAVDEAKRNAAVGAQLLLACSKYEDCCSDYFGGFHKKLARVVLTERNMRKDKKLIVDSCLMHLPEHFWSLAEFGERGTPSSEFSVWTEYLSSKRCASNRDARESFLQRAINLRPTSRELQRARQLGVVDGAMFPIISLSAWSRDEQENKELKRELFEAKKREEALTYRLREEELLKRVNMDRLERLQIRVYQLEMALGRSRHSTTEYDEY